MLEAFSKPRESPQGRNRNGHPLAPSATTPEVNQRRRGKKDEKIGKKKVKYLKKITRVKEDIKIKLASLERTRAPGSTGLWAITGDSLGHPSEGSAW